MFRPVQDPAVATSRRARGDRGRIGSGARLGERERADPFPGREHRQIGALLLLAPEVRDRRRADATVGANDRDESRMRAPELLVHERLREHRQAEAAVLLGDRQAEEAERAGLREDGRGDLVVVLDLSPDRLDLLLGELPDRAEQVGPLRGDAEVHQAFTASPAISGARRSSNVSRRRTRRDLPFATTTTAGRSAML